MPRGKVNYSNTIIYKITCKDPTIKHYFVGHTTNFSQKKHALKTTCSDSSKRDYNLQMFQIIRQYGGWDNWEMEEIAKYNCKDENEAQLREYQHQLMLNQQYIKSQTSQANEQKEEEQKQNNVKLNTQELQNNNNTNSDTTNNNEYTNNEFSINVYSGDDKKTIDMDDISESDINMLTNIILQLVKQNLFFKQLILQQNRRIIELSKKLGIPVEEEDEEEENNVNSYLHNDDEFFEEEEKTK
jgi:hypothetical protein